MQNLPAAIESRFLPFVQKPMQYIGNEINIIRKDPGSVRLHGVLCFPETYDIGMSHYGGQILYHIVNSNPSWALSRCYHPLPDAQRRMEETGIPLFCLEYLTPVSTADWIGFSVTYELQFTNIVSMLSLAGIPVKASERQEDTPIVLAGGCAVSNPEPIADFIDAFVIGDGEEAVVEVCSVLERMKSERAPRASRRETLIALSACKGVYVPSLYPVKRSGRFMVPAAAAGGTAVQAAKVVALNDDYYPLKPLVPLINVVHHRLAVEVMRGCTRGCRFCAAGMTYRPVRERAVSGLIRQMTESVAATGWRDIGLLSLSTADFSDLTRLLSETRLLTHDRHIRVSLPSTRIDALSEEDLDALQAITPFSSFTIAPEAGTQRLRDVINKGFTDKDIFAMVDTLLKRKIQTIKVYFMIGLPTEDADDIEGIVEMVRALCDRAWDASHRVSIHVSVSPFSPKPHTPFQWEAMDPPNVLFEKSHYIKKALQPKRNVKVSYRDPFMARLETVMARGDRSLSACILDAWKTGALFDGRDEHFDFKRWESAFAGHATDMQLFCDAIPHDQHLPWSAISTGVSADFLELERAKALSQRLTPDCRSGCHAPQIPQDASYGASCGICGAQVRTVLQKRSVQPTENTVTPKAAAAPGTERHCYRFIYEKGRTVRFLGHLDMMNVLQRAFLAARLPLAYSEGFHAHPLVAFGPPLSLSLAAENELLDMTTTTALTIDCASINVFLPDGLCIKRYFEIPLRHISLNEDICAGSYLFTFSAAAGSAIIDNAQLCGSVSQFLAQRDVTITVEKSGTSRGKNVRGLVHSIVIASNEGCTSFEAVLSMEPKNTCKPSELLAALFPDHHPSAWIVCRRACLHREHGTFRAGGGPITAVS
jgi:radical SAM family uncharacterized protein/radical SAM-linked protein